MGSSQSPASTAQACMNYENTLWNTQGDAKLRLNTQLKTKIWKINEQHIVFNGFKRFGINLDNPEIFAIDLSKGRSPKPWYA